MRLHALFGVWQVDSYVPCWPVGRTELGLGSINEQEVSF